MPLDSTTRDKAYRVEPKTAPNKAEITEITHVINFVLRALGNAWKEHAKLARNPGYDVYAALRQPPAGDVGSGIAARVSGHAILLLTNREKWQPESEPSQGYLFRGWSALTSAIRRFGLGFGRSGRRRLL